MIKKALAVALILIGYNIFFFSVDPRFGTFSLWGWMIALNAFILTAFWPTLSYHRLNQERLGVASLGLSTVLVTLSLLRASDLDSTLLSWASLVLSGYGLYILALDYIHVGAASEVLSVPMELFKAWFGGVETVLTAGPRWVGKNLQPLLSLFGQKISGEKSGNKLGAVIRGLIVTIPVLFVLVILLSSADPIFEALVRKIFSFQLPHLVITLPERVLSNIFLVAFFLPLALLKVRKKFTSPLQLERLKHHGVEALMVVGSVALVMAAFLIVQFRYLFASVPEADLHQFGVQTYSEYVRKGFGELLVVGVLIYSVVGGSLLVYRQKDGENAAKKSLRTANYILLAEGAVFVLSIFRRILLYQAEHGLTRIRVYGSVFLVMLLALMVILALRHVYNRQRWYLMEMAAMIMAVMVLGLVNIDHLIGKVYPPTVNQEIDYVYITRLSADGVEGWIDAYHHSQEVINRPGWAGRTEFSDAEAREVVYVRQQTRLLYQNYATLAQRYGDKEDIDALGITRVVEFPISQYNPGSWLAYQKLRRAISPQEVRALNDQAAIMSAALTPEQTTRAYDRSSQTPLLD